MARPKIEFTEKQYDMIDQLIKIQCTGEEIAAVLKVDYDTLGKRIKEKHEINLSEYIKTNKGAGRASLRRMQWKAAEKGNPTMLKWLGANILDQTDKALIQTDSTDKLQELVEAMNKTARANIE